MPLPLDVDDFRHKRFDPNGNPESEFRQRIRDILNLDWSTRDEKIYDELRRLKKLDGDL